MGKYQQHPSPYCIAMVRIALINIPTSNNSANNQKNNGQGETLDKYFQVPVHKVNLIK